MLEELENVLVYDFVGFFFTIGFICSRFEKKLLLQISIVLVHPFYNVQSNFLTKTIKNNIKIRGTNCTCTWYMS